VGLLTKNLKPIAQYQQWRPEDYSNGDILGIEESLGGRAAHSLTLESVDGNSAVRLNVSKKVYGFHTTVASGENWVGAGQGVAAYRPKLVDEIQQVTPLITIESGETQVWGAGEIAIRDIEVVISSGLKVTVT